jgi:hypothetical protein
VHKKDAPYHNLCLITYQCRPGVGKINANIAAGKKASREESREHEMSGV